MKYLISLFVTSNLLVGCASWKKETLAYMGGAMVGGAVLGAAQAPKGDDKAMHGLLWGSLASAAVGAALVYTRDDNEIIREREIEINTLKMKLSENKQLIDGGESQFLESGLPDGLQGLMQPGHWSLYKVDKWKKNKKGEFVHQDKVLEIKPAKMKIKK